MKTIKLSCCAALLCATVMAGERVSLFDGKTLAGWTLVTCEATVDDGDIFIKAGNGLVQTEKKYGDFIFEWKIHCASNSFFKASSAFLFH